MFTARTVIAVVIRPWLWATAIGALFGFARIGWWRRPPFLPIPDRSVLEWRVTTAFGQPNMALATDDVLSYLRWRKQHGPWK